MEKAAYIQTASGKLVDLYALGFINDHSQMVGDDDEHLDDPQDDAVHNYASAIIGYGLLANNFEDACNDGHGE